MENRTTYRRVTGDDNEDDHPSENSGNVGLRVVSSSSSIDPLATSLSLSDETVERHPLLNDEELFSRRWAVGLLSVATILLFADQNLMSPNLTAIAREFNFNDDERDRKLGGDIALAFFLLGAPASLLFGCLADSHNRTFLFAATVGIGELACLAAFWTRTYEGLYVSRAITGFALGGAIPLIYSLLGDLYSASERHRVNAVVGIGTGLGISLGQGIAGILGPWLGWRFPFLIISIPALIIAFLVLVTVRDPERGAMEEVNLRRDETARSATSDIVEMVHIEEDESALRMRSQDNSYDMSSGIIIDESHLTLYWAEFRNLLRTPTVLLCFLQGGPGCVPWGIVNSFLNDFLAQDRGFSVQTATFTVLIFGIGNFFGLLLGGQGGSYLYKRNPSHPPAFAGIAAILGTLPFWLMLNLIRASTWYGVTIVVSLLAGVLSGITGPIVKATLQNVTFPRARGQAFAMFNLFDDFGRGLGPVLVSRLISRMGGRTPAFNVGVVGWLLCGAANLAMYWTVQKDERMVQGRMIASMSSKD